MRIFPNPGNPKRGFTLAELLIVIAILAILLILVLMNFRTQISKGNDVKRKADLAKIQKSFEEYFNDRECYPPTTILSDCGSADLAPYLPKVPCDRVTKTPYLHIAGDPSECSGYHLCTKLENRKDPEIVRIGCHPVIGCGWELGYNYCVAVGAEIIAPDFEIPEGSETDEDWVPSPTPTATPRPGQYACSRGGRCNSYLDPSCGPGGGCCPFTYEASGCMYNGLYQCDDPANRCTSY